MPQLAGCPSITDENAYHGMSLLLPAGTILGRHRFDRIKAIMRSLGP